STRWIAAVIGLVLAALVLPPVWYLVQGSLVETTVTGAAGDFTFAHYRKLAEGERLAASLVNSVIFALGSAVVALLFGGVLAWVVERTNAPFKILAYLTTIISLGTPYVLYVTAWLFLLGKVGPVNDIYRAITGSNGVLINVHSMSGMVLIEGMLWSPLVFLLLSATLRTSNPEFEEAARMSGASVWDTIRRITVRLALPAVMALVLLVFIRAFEGFEVPALVGLPGRVNVVTTDIFLALKDTVPPDAGRASAFSVVLLGVVAVLLAFYNRISRSAERFHTVTGKGFRARPFDLGRGRWIAGGVIVVNFLFVLVLPNMVLLWASILPFFQAFRWKAVATFTLENYRAVLNSPFYLELVWNTLLLAAASATVVMVLTLFVGWLAARRKPGGWALDQLATMPLIFPGIVLGTAVMQIYLALPIPIYGTLWIILIAYVIRYLPYGMRYSYSGMLQIHRELEEAAGMSGAGNLVILRRIVLPLLAPAVASGWLFIFLLASRVLSLPILLAGPNSQTIAVAMYDMWTNGQGTELAAMGLLWTAIMTAIASAFYFLSRRSGAGVYGN
ncbi:MAG: Inner rane transporter permease protein YdcU, partial [Pseudomonadota bacterium]